MDWDAHKYVFFSYIRLLLVHERYSEIEELESFVMRYGKDYLDTHFYYGITFYYLKKREKCIEHLEHYLELCDLGSSLKSLYDFRLVHYSINRHKDVYNILIELFRKSDDLEKVLYYSWENEKRYNDGMYLEDLIRCCVELRKFEMINDVIDYISDNNEEQYSKLEAIIEQFVKLQKNISLIAALMRSNTAYGILMQARFNSAISQMSYEDVKKMEFDRLPDYYKELFYYALEDPSLFMNIIGRYSRVEIYNICNSCQSIFTDYYLRIIHISKKVLSYEYISQKNCLIVSSLLGFVLIDRLVSGDQLKNVQKMYVDVKLKGIDMTYSDTLLNVVDISVIEHYEDRFFISFRRLLLRENNSKKFLIRVNELIQQYEMYFISDELVQRVINVIENAEHLTEFRKIFSENRYLDVSMYFDKYRNILENYEDVYIIMILVYLQISDSDKCIDIIIEGLYKFGQSESFIKQCILGLNILGKINQQQILDYYYNTYFIKNGSVNGYSENVMNYLQRFFAITAEDIGLVLKSSLNMNESRN